MATLPNARTQDPDDEDLARLHRTIRNESRSPIDMWALPLETLGVSPLFESVLFALVSCDMGKHFLVVITPLLWNSET